MAAEIEKKRHHHGDLREALIEAGVGLLREGGRSALTLRRCAARAAVSHSAPAHYFKGLDGLLTAIAARGYRTFAATMIAERALAGADPKARLMAICDGYLMFAREHAALFGLMFSADDIGFEDPELLRESAAAYQVLSECCAPFRHGSAGSKGTEVMIWSLVHGFAMLSHKARAGDGHPVKDIRFADLMPGLTLRSAAPGKTNTK